MNKGSKPDAPRNQDALIEEAVTEFLLAEDRQQELDVNAWLEKHATIRDRLESFLDDHRRAYVALGNRQNSGAPISPIGLHDTASFDSSLNVSGSRSPTPLAPLSSIGNYRLLRLIGSGGMGRVYEAMDDQGHRFAIKLIAGHMAATPEAIERFQQEGIVASTVNHPRCVFVHAADTADGQPFIAMELMPGTTLRDMVQSSGPLSVPDAIAKIIDVIDGLICAHECNLIHRDVKPSNCYLDEEGRVKVGDFGLAKSLESDAGLTLTGSIVGTPLFASPEQLRGDSLDARTDVYSTCATLYYLLIGKAPFEHSSATAVIARVLSEDVGSLRTVRGDIPVELDRAIAKGMSRNRDQRPRDMKELREQLSQFLPGQRRLAGLGLRFAAFCIDMALISILFSIAAFLRPDWFSNAISLTPSIRFESHFLASVASALYFFVCESAFQSTLGKRLFRLRIRSSSSGHSLTTVQCSIRIAVWWMLSGIITDSLLHVMGRPLLTSFNDPLQWLGYALGYGLNCLPLIWRKDQRLLHDLASRTQVEFVKRTSERSTVLAFAGGAHPAMSEPFSVGRFTVTRNLKCTPECTWYEGKDPRLARTVWLAIRPLESPELTETRRRLTRPLRLRWISSGLTDTQRWDSFLGVDSIALSEMEDMPQGLSWPKIREALRDLALEIATNQSETNEPAILLAPESLRVGRDGRIVWLDHFAPSHTSPPSSTERERLDFLNHVALSLFSSNECSVPFHATHLMDRLSPSHPDRFEDVAQLLVELNAAEDRPSESNFRMRAVQFATQCGLSLAPFGAMLALVSAGHLLRLDRVEDELLRLYALRHIASSDVAEPSYAAIANHSPWSNWEAHKSDATWKDELERAIAKLEGVESQAESSCSRFDTATLNSAGEVFVNANLLPHLIAENKLPERGSFVWELPAELPAAQTPMWAGSSASTSTVSVTEKMRTTFSRAGTIPPDQLALAIDRVQRAPGHVPLRGAWRVVFLSFSPWILLSLWGMATRGGLSQRIAGLVVVNGDGRLASRPRLLLRSTLLWAPLGILISSTILLEYFGWTTPLISSALRAGCVIGPFVYLAIGILSRGRGFHDRWSGTQVVPN